jgi:hypothetical protein
LLESPETFGKTVFRVCAARKATVTGTSVRVTVPVAGSKEWFPGLRSRSPTAASPNGPVGRVAFAESELRLNSASKSVWVTLVPTGGFVLPMQLRLLRGPLFFLIS